MIEKVKCEFNDLTDISLHTVYDEKLEFDALEFVGGGVPIEWRFVWPTGSTAWMPGLRAGCADALRAFHDLQVPTRGGTRGTAALHLQIETRGIGDCTLFLWLRDGTTRKRQQPLTVIQEGCEA